jgi:hypothetical protein
MLHKTKSRKIAILKFGFIIPLCIVAITFLSSAVIELNDFKKLRIYLQNQIKYPTEMEETISGRVVISFKTHKGKISSINIVHGLNNEFDNAVTSALKSYVDKIKAPDDEYTIAIRFQFQEQYENRIYLGYVPPTETKNFRNLLNEVTVLYAIHCVNCEDPYLTSNRTNSQ